MYRAAVLLGVLVTVVHGWSLSECPPPPLCENKNSTFMQKVWCRVGDPFARNSGNYATMVKDRMQFFMARNLIGQEHLTSKILSDVAQKIRRPSEPLILHFAGDNGVGKTTTAELISAAMSFRCHKANTGHYCSIGEEALSLSGTNYHGMSVENFRKSMVPQVLEFAKRFPFGVVILNDLTELDPQHVAVLMPLLGRSHYFSEDLKQEVDLRRLLVIVTTDFGKQGRTRGKSIADLHQMVEDEVRSSFGTLAGSHLRTYAFVPATIVAAREIAKLMLYDWACSERMHDLHIEEEAVEAAVDSCIGQVALENGRAVMKHMVNVLGEFYLSGISPARKNVTVRRSQDGKIEMHVESAEPPSGEMGDL